MDSACSTHGDVKGSYNILIGKPERKRPLGRPKLIRDVNMKKALMEIWYEGVH
jgi:hypothetical protein